MSLLRGGKSEAALSVQGQGAQGCRPLLQRLIVLAHLVSFVCIRLYVFFFLNDFLKDYLF